MADYGEALTLLMGNHDIPYWQCFHDQQIVPYPEFETSQYGTLDAGVISEKLSPEVWQRMRFLHTEGKVLFTHAGLNAVNYGRWRSEPKFRSRLRRLAHPIRTAYRQKAHEIFAVGAIRHGRSPLGGLLWQDWQEWTDNTIVEPIPGAPWQAFGHTRGLARTHGNAVCFDGTQTLYATWDAAGFVVRHAATGAPALTVPGIPPPPRSASQQTSLPE